MRWRGCRSHRRPLRKSVPVDATAVFGAVAVRPESGAMLLVPRQSFRAGGVTADSTTGTPGACSASNSTRRQSSAHTTPQMRQVRFLQDCPCQPRVQRSRAAVASAGRPMTCIPRSPSSTIRRPALRTRAVAYPRLSARPHRDLTRTRKRDVYGINNKISVSPETPRSRQNGMTASIRA